MEVKFNYNSNNNHRILDYLVSKNIYLNNLCGGYGNCNKCLVKVLNGSFVDSNNNVLLPDNNSMIHACKAYPTSDFILDINDELYLCDNFQIKGHYDIAIDLGTTTICFAFISKKGGNIEYYTTINPQYVYGSDILSRITASKSYLSELQSLIISKIKDVIKDANIDKIVVTGNTAMLHVFAGISPQSLGVFPFEAKFTNSLYLTGNDLNLSCNSITLMPSSSAYIGADILGGAFISGVLTSKKPQMIIDIGTNSEIIITNGKKIYSTSAAAGPAFEGNNISCGVASISGAIYSFNKDLTYKTIDNKNPIGICGSGLIDLIAQLLNYGIIDNTGLLNKDFDIPNTNLKITQKDIREFQLAKSAVYTSITSLLKIANISFNDIDSIYIAGAFGKSINIESAKKVGIIPNEIINNKIKTIGDSALKSAIDIINNESMISTIEQIAKSINTIELNTLPNFEKDFINNLNF